MDAHRPLHGSSWPALTRALHSRARRARPPEVAEKFSCEAATRAGTWSKEKILAILLNYSFTTSEKGEATRSLTGDARLEFLRNSDSPAPENA